MLDDFVTSQLILKALRSQQKTLKDQMEDHKRLIHSQNTEINKLNKKVDSTHVKEVRNCLGWNHYSFYNLH